MIKGGLNACNIQQLVNFGIIYGVIYTIEKLPFYSNLDAVINDIEEWNLGPIIDIQTFNSSCPSNYEQLQGSYYGTNQICKEDNDSYSLKECNKHKDGYT